MHVSGTTNNAGQITVYDNSVDSKNAYCVSNISEKIGTPYIITVSNCGNGFVTFRVRKISDNSAVLKKMENCAMIIK